MGQGTVPGTPIIARGATDTKEAKLYGQVVLVVEWRDAGECSMSSELFWLSNAQWEVISPHLPVKQRGPKRISDRTVISGIIHVLESGCTWRACPRAYGAYMTVFNRYNRWKQRGLWQRILAEVRNSDQFGDLSLCERLIRASECGASSADGIVSISEKSR